MLTLIHSQPTDWPNRPQRTDEENGDRPEVWTLPPAERARLEKLVAQQRAERELPLGWFGRLVDELCGRTK